MYSLMHVMCNITRSNNKYTIKWRAIPPYLFINVLKYLIPDIIAIMEEIHSNISPNIIPSFIDTMFDNIITDIDII